MNAQFTMDEGTALTVIVSGAKMSVLTRNQARNCEQFDIPGHLQNEVLRTMRRKSWPMLDNVLQQIVEFEQDQE